MTSVVTIVADVHEQKSGVRGLLEELGVAVDRAPLATGVPGISVATARALLDRLGSVAAVLSAEPEEWLDAPGVGPGRARVLAEMLNHRWGSLP